MFARLRDMRLLASLAVVLLLAVGFACGEDEEVAAPAAAPAAPAAAVAAARAAQAPAGAPAAPAAPAPAARAAAAAPAAAPAVAPAAAMVAKPAPRAAPAMAARTKAPGTLRLASGSFLHNTLKIYQDAHLIGIPAFDVFIALDETHAVRPGAITSWTQSANSQDWTFDMRPGMKFHDGSPVEAKDVLGTLTLWMDPVTGGSTPTFFQDHLITADIIDADTVEVTFDAPKLNLLTRSLSFKQPTMIIDQDAIETLGLEPAFDPPNPSGAFRVTNFVPSAIAEYEAFLDHWDRPSDWGQLEFTLVAEESTRVAMIATGQADLADVTTLGVAAAEKAGANIIATPPLFTKTIFFTGLWQPDAPGYDPDLPQMDVRVREALGRSVDRQKIIDNIHRGLSLTQYYPYLGPNSVGLAPCLAKYPEKGLDLAVARQLLVDAGYPGGKGLELTLGYHAIAGSEDAQVLQSIAADWIQDLGVKINLLVVESGYRTALDERAGVDFNMLASGAADIAYNDGHFNYHTPNGRYKRFDAGADEFQALYEELLAEFRPAQRAVLECELSVYLRDNWALIGLTINPAYRVTGPAVGAWPQQASVWYAHDFHLAEKAK